ncbi:MAG: NIL domain-containing protein [Deltaproteobacteria bacterium]|nr:NIL domain-containing protein [Deltaproteobacteria bacterium]
MRERHYLSYPKTLIREPILYQLVKKFDLVFNIRGASVSEDMGLVAVEFEGTNDQIERAIAWLRATGVTVEPIEKNVIE